MTITRLESRFSTGYYPIHVTSFSDQRVTLNRIIQTSGLTTHNWGTSYIYRLSYVCYKCMARECWIIQNASFTQKLRYLCVTLKLMPGFQNCLKKKRLWFVKFLNETPNLWWHQDVKCMMYGYKLLPAFERISPTYSSTKWYQMYRRKFDIYLSCFSSWSFICRWTIHWLTQQWRFYKSIRNRFKLPEYSQFSSTLSTNGFCWEKRRYLSYSCDAFARLCQCLLQSKEKIDRRENWKFVVYEKLLQILCSRINEKKLLAANRPEPVCLAIFYFLHVKAWAYQYKKLKGTHCFYDAYLEANCLWYSYDNAM